MKIIQQATYRIYGAVRCLINFYVMELPISHSPVLNDTVAWDMAAIQLKAKPTCIVVLRFTANRLTAAIKLQHNTLQYALLNTMPLNPAHSLTASFSYGA